MDDYSILRLKQQLQKAKQKDPSHLQSDFKHFVKNYKLDFDFWLNKYLEYRTFNEKLY